MWIAHRGYSKKAPENTLAAFRAAEEHGAHAIELDVQVTREGIPVVFHDQLMNRVTSMRGRLTARTFSQLQAARVGQEKIPTLQETLHRTKLPIFLEVKDPHGIDEMLRVASPHKKRVTLISFHPHVLVKAKQAGFKTGLLTVTGVIGRRLAPRLKVDYLAPHARYTGRKLIEAATKHGIKVLPWGAKSPEHARELLERGAHGVISDEPFHLQKAEKKVA